MLVEALSNLALYEILTNRFHAAHQSIERIRQLYSNQRHDIQTGLRARLAIKEQNFEDAMGYCEKLEDPHHPIHMTLRLDAIRGLLEHTNMPARKRAGLEATAADLERQLRGQYGSTHWEVEPE